MADQKLVARVRRGDDRAFEELYERYHRRIHAYVLGMVKDHGRAEDVTQEVFLSALRRMRETEQPLAFKPWLYQIAKNSCIDAFRRSRRTEEVSYDADDGLAPADHSKLVAPGASPDAAVAAKQELDSLCGAFGGLSETHHEILVLRELEGLSYAQIGERMGMSRPAVESTLFRARRRLTEEYDDIVSGARCLRIQGIIVTAVESRLGTRDTRRLARHLSHCQPCRREAMAAGLDRELFARPSVRERVANKVAGILPFPIFAKFRREADTAASASTSSPPSGRGAAFMQHLPMVSDHLQSGWGKAAAGAAVLVASVGAGVGVKEVASGGPAAPAALESSTQRASRTAAPAKTATPTPASTSRERAETDGSNNGGSSSGTRRGDDGGAVKDAAARGGGVSGASPGGKGGAGNNVGGTQPPTTNAPGTPVVAAGSNPDADDKPAANKPAAKKKPSEQVKEDISKATAPARNVVKETTDNVQQTVDETTDAVEETTNQVTEGVNQVTQQTTQAVDDTVETVTGPGPVAETVDKTTDKVDKIVEGTTKVVQKVVAGVLYTLDATTGQVISAVQLVTGASTPPPGG
ncbi:sigma-70 family RNA polymerase sigma factor [Solirubrobacter phytolaccae]|uniref:RNA polymerase sigma factor n=1 Tax=Solirubrobacter phytolaccae TaxID=1404360 RepID=A0A9X3SAF0_9ACTN|nr:sigma-70 family RNA polymerase sigma factor [Solirubrobacter phytolaccae]MDA0183588.1 sigma-70 family RNA polymerase sigma factor [Solirubrobacter phytolaccae]